MHPTLLRRRTSRTAAALVASDGAVIFLTGQAWDHTNISYRIRTDTLAEAISISVIRRAVQSWNDALAASPAVRLRDFQLVPAAHGDAPDVDVYLGGGADAVDSFTEIVSDREGAIVQATVRLIWPGDASPADLGLLGTLAVRGIGRALGLGNAADPADPMYPAFNGVKLKPSRSDIAALAAVEEWYLAGSPFFYPPGGYTVA